jgi:glycosyltransferase involved in cell wall biosynthesis
MKILILCDHYPLSPRVKKMRTSLNKLYPNSTVKVFAWNRSNYSIIEDYVISFNQSIGYGKKLRKLFNILKFAKKARTIKNEFKPDYIHSIDAEMLIVSSLIFQKCKLVYEVYDIKYFRNKFINWVREKTEFHIIKRYVNGIIFASPFFDIYYKEKGIQGVKTITINNKPAKDVTSGPKSDYMSKYNGKLQNKIVVGFIGTIRYESILINLIDACMELDNIIVLLAGNGPFYNYINSYVGNNDMKTKVIMTGRYSSEDLESIYESCDYIWAAYPNKNLNVKYAISNKFFESLIFRRKIIVSESTMIGDYVSENNVGLTVNPYSVEGIRNLLKSLNKNIYSYSMTKISIGKGLYWEDEEEELRNIYDK